MRSTPIDDQCILLRDICYTARRISFLALACDSVLGCSGDSLFATLTRAPLAQLTRADKLLYRQRSNPARMNKEALVPHPLSLCALTSGILWNHWGPSYFLINGIEAVPISWSICAPKHGNMSQTTTTRSARSSIIHPIRTHGQLVVTPPATLK